MLSSLKASEKALLASFLRVSNRYLEFGSGESTCFAATIVKKNIISVDSSKEWTDKVAEECRDKNYPVQPQLIHVDIGKTGNWGWPEDATAKAAWPRYHSDIWEQPGVSDTDTYFVDGRFRVACFMQILLHSRSDAVIGIHDFTSRSHFHVIRDVAREIACADDLSIFVRKDSVTEEQISAVLRKYALIPQ